MLDADDRNTAYRHYHDSHRLILDAYWRNEMVGLWGDQVGDVVVALEGGYQLGRADSPVAVADNRGHVASGHGGHEADPRQHRYGTEKAIFVISGPGIKQGYERPSAQVGHVRLLDVTPTLCHLLGIQPPAQAQGAIIYDLLEGHEIARQRPNPTPQVEGLTEYKRWFLETSTPRSARRKSPYRASLGSLAKPKRERGVSVPLPLVLPLPP